MKIFNIANLKGRSVDDDGQNTTRELFHEQVAKEKWSAKGTVEEKWTAIKTALKWHSLLGKEDRCDAGTAF